MKPTFDLWSQKDYITRMKKSALVRARIEPALKRKAEKILAELGLNASDAIHLLYRQVALHQALPFPLHTPNAATARPSKPPARARARVVIATRNNSSKTSACDQDLFRETLPERRGGDAAAG